MGYITWDSSYTVNVRSCDLQHQKLFQLINALQEAMKTGKARAYAQRIVEELRRYTESHFQAEEALLERTNYPALAEHRAQHHVFISQIEKFEADLAGGAHISISLMDFLKNWLTNHIQTMDRKYSNHLNHHGVH